MLRKGSKNRIITISGLVLLAVGIAVAVLLYSLRYRELWYWYDFTRTELALLEQKIAAIPQRWLFIVAVLFLFFVKCFIPIYLTSSVCFLTGLVLPMYLAIPVNILGMIIMLSVKYYWGYRFGAGTARKIIGKSERLKNLIEHDGKGNPSLLVMIRLIPGFSINTVSSVYGSMKFGYWNFIILSIIGFMPRLISFTFVGRNAYDPLSPGFLVPIMLLCFATGLTLLSINGIILLVEKIVNKTKKDVNNDRKDENKNG